MDRFGLNFKLCMSVVKLTLIFLLLAWMRVSLTESNDILDLWVVAGFTSIECLRTIAIEVIEYFLLIFHSFKATANWTD